MAQITAALVKDLREKSGAGMMDCKKALSENDGDLEAAVDWLRTKGLSAAAKKAGRVAAEGLVGVVAEGTTGSVLEVNAETDFVARNDGFQEFVETATGLVASVDGDLEKLKDVAFPGEERNVAEQLTHMIATIGENMALRRSATLSVSKGVVASYVHTAVRPTAGKIGVLVALESDGDAAKLAELGKNVAMHVAATSPLFLNVDAVDAAAVDRERAIFAEQAAGSGKPPEIVEKMVEGRVRKYYEEVVLEEQNYVMADKTKVKAAVVEVAKELGTDVKLTGFVRFALGEGIEKKEEDFAAEVAKTASGG